MRLVDNENNFLGNIQSDCVMQRGDTVFVNHTEYVVVDIVHRITICKHECEVVLNEVRHVVKHAGTNDYINST